LTYVIHKLQLAIYVIQAYSTNMLKSVNLKVSELIMCEAVIMSQRSKKELFVPMMAKKSNFNREVHYFSKNKAKVLDFSPKQAEAS